MAQKQLRTVWGMELRELPVREKLTLQEKRQGGCCDRSRHRHRPRPYSDLPFPLRPHSHVRICRVNPDRR